jgi:hypothetical protein
VCVRTCGATIDRAKPGLAGQIPPSVLKNHGSKLVSAGWFTEPDPPYSSQIVPGFGCESAASPSNARIRARGRLAKRAHSAPSNGPATIAPQLGIVVWLTRRIAASPCPLEDSAGSMTRVPIKPVLT